MNKKLLTLAIGASFAVPAMMAQADVKVYGAAQVEIARIKNDSTNAYPGTQSSLNNNAVVANDEKTATVDNKRGRFGIAADEDLGNGMKGLAKFEWNVDTADGTDANATGGDGPLAVRETYVGLQGPFGTVRLGRMNSPYKNSGTALDPFVTTSLEARNNFGMSGNADGYGILTAHNSFVSDGLFYTSPTLVGITLDIYVGLDGTGANLAAGSNAQGAQTNGDLSAVLGWKGGPVNVFVGYNKANNVVKTAVLAPEPTAMKIGGQFKFAKMHTISVQYEKTDVDDAATNDTDEGDYLFLGYQLKLGNTTIVAQGGLFENGGGSVTLTDNQEATYYVLGAIYNFSKTFRVFGGWRATELEDESVAPTVRDDSVLTVGMRKDF